VAAVGLPFCGNNTTLPARVPKIVGWMGKKQKKGTNALLVRPRGDDQKSAAENVAGCCCGQSIN
jgi:hypothetical protein